ncbi:MAG: transposase, partial [Acidobacteria bacterium]|nr:transposase [Acidobacteriota bacterium]
LIPYGQGYEGAHHISDGSYGYKLLTLLNLQPDCELVAGYVLGGLQESEITMLRRLLKRLQEKVAPLREWLKILVMDRGYWGTDLFYELKRDYGIEFVSRIRDDKLEINGAIQRQLEEADRRWTTIEEERQFSGRREQQRVRLTVLRPITLISDETKRQIEVNVVVAVQSHLDGSPILDKKGKDISASRYVTSLRPGPCGKKVRGFYRGRWGIENQGFRALSQTWDINRPAGHSYGAVLARLVFVFMIYNAAHLFKKQSEHRPDFAEDLRRRRHYGPGRQLAGAAAVVLTESGACCGMRVQDLLRLYKQRLKRAMQQDAAAGRSLSEILDKLDTT